MEKSEAAGGGAQARLSQANGLAKENVNMTFANFIWGPSHWEPADSLGAPRNSVATNAKESVRAGFTWKGSLGLSGRVTASRKASPGAS